MKEHFFKIKTRAKRRNLFNGSLYLFIDVSSAQSALASFRLPSLLGNSSL